MGLDYFIVDCCGEIFCDAEGNYTYCETCGAVLCAWCLEKFGVVLCDGDGELFECPLCDQFRHMNPEYNP